MGTTHSRRADAQVAALDATGGACNEACSLSASGTLSWRGALAHSSASFLLKRSTATLQAGQSRKLKVIG